MLAGMRTVLLAGVLTAGLIFPLQPAAAAPAQPAPVSAQAEPTAWPADGFDPANTGWNPAETQLVPAALGVLTQRWSIAATGQEVCARQTAPVVSGGRLFLTGREGVSAYDAGTGRKQWTFPYADPSDTVSPSLTVSGGLVLVASYGCQSSSDPDGLLTALDAVTGKVRWEQPTDAPAETLIVDRDVVVVGGEDSGGMATTAFAAGTGRRLWQKKRAMPHADVSAAGIVLLTTTDTNTGTASGAVALDIATGRQRWKTAAAWTVEAADPAGGFFLVNNPAGALLKVAARTGAIAWSRRGLAGPVAVDDKHVYIATAGTAVYCADLVTGARVWKRGGYTNLLRPVVAGGVLYPVEAKARLTSLVAATGFRLGFTASTKPTDHPVIADGVLYLTDGSRLRAYTK